MRTHDQRLETAREILDGLSVGDAIGEALSYQHYRARELADFSMFRPGTVRYTDDTEMALALFETLKLLRGIDEDAVAWAYSSRYRRDPERGYGKMARKILEEIGTGAPWREVSMKAFGGGSFGNGAAMRVAPLGGYFADDREAILSTVETGGDCDTNCAIVGGIVTAYLGNAGIPKDWLSAREPLRFDHR